MYLRAYCLVPSCPGVEVPARLRVRVAAPTILHRPLAVSIADGAKPGSRKGIATEHRPDGKKVDVHFMNAFSGMRS